MENAGKSKSSVSVVDESNEKHDTQRFYDTYTRYIALSRYLFGVSEPINDINEMPKNCIFYADARKIAEELRISWKDMSHAESNRIMLALLDDYYNAMAEVADSKKLAIEVDLKILK